MKSSNKESFFRRPSQSDSFVLPSEDFDHDNISDKEVDSVRERGQLSNKKPSRPLVPSLDLSFPESKDDKSEIYQDGQQIGLGAINGQINFQQKNFIKKINATCGSTDLVSPIQSVRQPEQTKPEANIRTTDSDKTATNQSQSKSNKTPDKNPQSQMFNSIIRQQDSDEKPSQKEKKKDQGQLKNSPPPLNKQPYGLDSNFNQKKGLKVNNIPKQSKFFLSSYLDTKDPKKTNKAELSLDDDEVHKHNATTGRAQSELFNDSQVSVIQRTTGNQHQFAEEGYYEDQVQDEDTSARRLLHNESEIERQRQQPQNKNRTNQTNDQAMKDKLKINDQPTQEILASGSLIIKPKDFTQKQEVDQEPRFQHLTIQEAMKQTRRDSRSMQQFRKSNRIAPIQTHNLSELKKKSQEDLKTQNEDYFQFEDVEQSNRSIQSRQMVKNLQTFKTADFELLTKTNEETLQILQLPHSGILRNYKRDYHPYQNSYRLESNNTETIQDISCLLDESIIKKNLDMPNLNSNKVQLEQQLGLVIQKEELKFHEELLKHNDDSFYRIIDKDSIEIVESYTDRCPCLQSRKAIMKLRVYINRMAIAIITNGIFETISIIVIVANSLFLALDDPLALEPPVYAKYSDLIFQILYTIEMVLKILALGFLFNKGAYLRDAWNILDFIIVSSGYLGMILEGGGANLSVLRSFRVIRPLRTISSIQGLRIIVQALINSMPLLRDTILVLIFFFIIFAIAGVQLFSGVMKNRCFYLDTGRKDPKDVLCSGDDTCLPGQFCGKGNANPNNDSTNFDNVLYAMLLVFQTVTMEGWTSNMIDLQMAVASWVVIYFYPIVFIGAFFLLNLTLAVIKSKFTEEMNKSKENNAKKKTTKKKVKKKGIDDDTDNEEERDQLKALEQDDPHKFREMLEQMPLQAIEENPDLSPDLKKSIKQKRKLEDLIKKMENALKEKENKEKSLSPEQKKERQEQIQERMDEVRLLKNKSDNLDKQIDNLIFKNQDFGDLFRNGSMLPSQYLSSMGTSSSQLLPDLGSKANSVQTPLLETNDLRVGRFNQRRNQTFKVKAEETIKEDADESHDLTVLLDDQPKTATVDGKRKSQLNYSNNMSMNDFKKQITNKANQVSQWLEKQVGHNQQSKIMMSGIAGIKQLKDPQSSNAKLAYERLQQDFDIFKYLDHEDNFGDDENSDTEEYQQMQMQEKSSSSDSGDGDQNPDSARNPIRSGSNHNEIDRKSTVATTVTKQITIQRRSSRENYGLDQNSNLDLVSPQKEKSLDQHLKLKIQKKKSGDPYKRRQTVMLKLKDMEIEEDEEEEKEPEKPKSIKEKALALFKKSPKKSPPKLTQKQIRMKKEEEERANFQNSLAEFKREIIKETRRKSKRPSSSRQPRTSTQPRKSMTQKSYHRFLRQQTKKGFSSPQSKTNKSTISEEMSTKNMTVRAKSEQRKKTQLHKETIVFNERIEIMKKRRNEFFAEAVRNIGKSKLQINREKMEKVLKKRLIQLGGGFELPDSPELKKKKFLRSGTLALPSGQNNLMLQQYEEFKSPENGGIDKDFIYEFKHVKEEFKKEQEEEEIIPDMEQQLLLKKKKIALKLKNYKFSSVHDIFENRDHKAKAEAELHGKAFVKKTKKEKKLEQLKEREIQKKKKKEAKGVKAFQKKVVLASKKFHEDLDELKESDDNQDDALRKLEDMYNKTHKSDIYVTGTLSIVFDKPKHENKMMNINYYYNIHPENFLPKDNGQVKSSETNQRITSQNDLINKNILISAFGEPGRVESKESQENNMSLGSIGGQSLLQQSQLGETVKRARPQSRTNASNYGNSRLRSQFATMSPGLKKRKGAASPMLRSANAAGRVRNQQSAVGASTVNASTRGVAQSLPPVVTPKPEIMSDRQILRRLNNNVKNSKVFKNINFQSLPDTIKRQKGQQDLLLMKKMKKHKKKPKKNAHEAEDHEDISDTSEENEGFDNDIYLDRDLDNAEEVQKAKEDAGNRGIDRVEWSGQDIMMKFDPYKARIALDQLNEIRVWPHGIHGYVKRWRVLLKRIMRHAVIENLMTLCVFANTIILAMDHYGIDDTTSNILGSFNTFFTIIFSCEMFLKIIAIGITKYLNDKMNYMDGGIVLMSLIEMIFLSGNGALSAFRSVRMFRTLRVLRVARLLRGLKSMMSIIAVIQRSISSFIYLGMLLFLFIFIYALLGMQLFGGNFQFLEGDARYNFDTFNQAFVTSFILLSMENWNSVLFNGMQSDVNKGITVVYFISCIFIGNFMLLNLFLAILLDSFTQVDEEDHETPEKKALREKQQIEELNQQKGEQLIQGIDDIENNQNNEQGNKKKKNKKKKKKKSKEEPVNNMLDESIEIDMEALTQKQELNNKKKEILFDGIECERSLYLFDKKNIIRIWTYKIVTNQKFENFILVLIVLSSIKLIYDTYLFDVSEEDLRVVVSGKLDMVFTALFTSECVLKCISYGFVQCNNSYLRETWSQMDFFIVVTSLIDATFSNVNIPIIKILRLLRILRPLRFISHNSSMKTVVIALLSSMGAIFNVGIVVVCVFLMFAILGVNLYAGKLQYCTVDQYQIDNKIECFKNRGEWKTYNFNMDNVLNAMITLFVVATLEGWPDMMYTYTDINGLELGPKPNASPINAYFFVCFVFIGAFFFMNLFVGVLFMNFEAAQRDEKEALLLDSSEMNWVDMMRMITSAKPEIIKIPKNRVSEKLYEFTKAESKFDFFIMICIILNMVQMAITFEGQTDSYTRGLEITNYFFTAVFTLEAILKLIANGWAYFIPGWHKFDFFVVCSSFLDIIMGQLSATSLKFLKVGPQLARVLRVLRVSRLFRLLNKAKGLQALLQTITFSIGSLMNVFALLMLVYFIFAVLGVFMFREITQGSQIDPVFMNFTNFTQAMMILLRCSTGEDWPSVMYDTMNTSEDCIPGVNCGYSYSPIFFIVFIMIQTYVMLNLFVLIILQQFELYYLPQQNILSMFREDLDSFKITWLKYAKEYEGVRIKANDLVAFFKDLGGNLAFGNASDQEILRNLVKMNLERQLFYLTIYSDEEGFIYFNELLFKAMKRIYGKERTKKKILADFELKALEKLINIKKKQQAKARSQERIKAVTVNPFLAVMYKNMSFKAWIKQYKKNLPKRQEEKEYGLDRESSDEEQMAVLGDEFEYVTDQDLSCHSDDFSDNDDDNDNDNDAKIVDKELEKQEQEKLIEEAAHAAETNRPIIVSSTIKPESKHNTRSDINSHSQSSIEGLAAQGAFKIKLQQNSNDKLKSPKLQKSLENPSFIKQPQNSQGKQTDKSEEIIDDSSEEIEQDEGNLSKYISVVENPAQKKEQQDYHSRNPLNQ